METTIEQNKNYRQGLMDGYDEFLNLFAGTRWRRKTSPDCVIWIVTRDEITAVLYLCSQRPHFKARFGFIVYRVRFIDVQKHLHLMTGTIVSRLDAPDYAIVRKTVAMKLSMSFLIHPATDGSPSVSQEMRARSCLTFRHSRVGHVVFPCCARLWGLP